MSNLSALALCGALFFVPQDARAENTTCTGTLSGTFDNINVPRRANCVIGNSHVKGTIYVRANASLKVNPQTVILGNIQAEGARFVRLFGAGVFINGSVQIKYGTRATVIHPETRIGGSVQYVESSGSFHMRGARVGQDVQVFENDEGTFIYNNVINGNLQCKENDPAPAGGNNRVGGNKEDQCAGF